MKPTTPATHKERCCKNCKRMSSAGDIIRGGDAFICVDSECTCHQTVPSSEGERYTLAAKPVGNVWFNGVEYTPTPATVPMGEWENDLCFFTDALFKHHLLDEDKQPREMFLGKVRQLIARAQESGYEREN